MTLPGRWRWTAVALLLLAAAVPLLSAGGASAHPLGNFTINRYARIEVYGEALRVYYVLDYAEIPAFQLKETVDADRDGVMSPDEVRAHLTSSADELANGMTLAVDGEPLAVTAVEQSGQVLDGQAGLEVLRLIYVYEAPVQTPGEVSVSYEDRNFSGRAGWREVVVRPSEGAAVTVALSLLTDRSNELLDYPAESLNAVADVSAASFQWKAGTGAEAPAGGGIVEAEDSGRSRSGFASLLESEQSAGIIVLSLLAALGFGTLHALGPGHGKTVVAAYLVGSRGTIRHALALGLTVTATHTSTVYLLGLITLTASQFIVPEKLYLYLGVASGAMVVLMGAALLTSRLRSARRPGDKDGHRHAFFGKAHTHAPAEQHPGHHAHGHEHEAGKDAHAHGTPAVGWRGLLTLGIAGGMIPCPSAIVVMLAAISVGQVLFGMLLIVAFSLGLAGVLTAIGVALVVGKRLSGRFGAAGRMRGPAVQRAIGALPLLSAMGVTIAGALITYQAWTQPGL